MQTRQIDFRRCVSNFPYYASVMLKIKDMDAQLRYLDFNEPQTRLHRLLEDLKHNNRLRRVIVLKARREGVSTYAEGLLFHAAHMNHNTSCLAIAHEQESCETIFNMCRLFYDCLPVGFRPMTRYNTKKDLTFENPDDKTRHLNPGLRSALKVMTAGKKNVARSGGYHNVHACFDPLTEVLTSDYGIKRICDLRIGDEILAGDCSVTQVSNVFSYDMEDSCIEITAWNNSGAPLCMTRDHRLLTDSGMKRAEDITLFDKLAFPIHAITNEIGSLSINSLLQFRKRSQGGGSQPKMPKYMDIVITNELGKFLGFYLAEGSLGSWDQDGIPRSVTLTIHEKEREFVEHLQTCIEVYFGIIGKFRSRSDSKTVNVEYKGAVFARFIYAIFGTDKTIPRWFFKCGRGFVLNVVCGYIFGDGSNSASCDRISVTSVRPQLSIWVRSALLALGIGYSSLEYRVGGNKYGRNCKEAWILGISGQTFRGLQQQLGIVAKYIGQSHIEKWIFSDDRKYVYVKIRSIEQVYRSEVLDVQVTHPSHTYLTIPCVSHNSEVASWQFPEDVLPALLPTIPKTPNNFVIFESTAKGVGNYFHNEWLKAESGESNFAPFFLAWYDLPYYIRQFNTLQERSVFMQTLNEEEKELSAKHNITLEQLYWRRTTLADYAATVGGEQLFRQEYPATPEEAFIVSGVPIFDRNKLRKMALRCATDTKFSTPKFRGHLTSNGLIVDPHTGELKIWEFPRQHGKYVLGVDVADGGVDGDYSCIELFRLFPLNVVQFAEQVAEWHGHISPVAFAGMVEKLARLYNNALVSVEVDSYGRTTQEVLMRTYDNLYQAHQIDRFDDKLTNKVGWETSVKSKKLLISIGSHCITNESIIVHSSELVREFMTFVRDQSGGASAAGSGHDDRVMAALIALFTMHQELDPELSEEDKITTVTSPISIPPNYIDEEFARLQGRFSHEFYEHWMNY